MKNKLLILFVLITSSLLAQKLPREILNGQLVAESISVDDILITNKTAKTATVSKKDGSFQIAVHVKDTLVFSGFNIPRQLLIISESDLKFNVLQVQLESQATNLEEVIINPNALTGDLKKDNDNIKITRLNSGINTSMAVTRLYEDDLQSSPDNKLMPGYLDGTYMMDFAQIGKKIVRAFKRNEAQKNRNKDVSSFSVVVQSRFSNDFFRNNLKIEEAELQSFLNFCEKDSKAKEMISNANDFELIDYLNQKKVEFNALKKE